MKLCQERAESEEQRKAMEAEVERMHENQLEQQDKLSELIDKVNDQAKMVGEMQQNQITLQSGIRSQDSTTPRASASTRFSHKFRICAQDS